MSATESQLQKTMRLARFHLVALRRERAERPGHKHVDDRRVATEIAAHQFDLGKMEKALTDQNERWRVAAAENLKTIAAIQSIYSELQKEMDIATFRPGT